MILNQEKGFLPSFTMFLNSNLEIIIIYKGNSLLVDCPKYSQTLMLKPCSSSGICVKIKIFRINPIIARTIPRYRQFFALLGSSCRKTKKAINPPINPRNIGNKNHRLLLDFSGYI